ncbi:MAG: L-threonylcarbamoyladenylate synthase [Thermoproteota archaeon]
MIELTCSNSDLDNASKIVLNGGIVIFPTDTVYGLGCDPFNNISVERIFTIKKRSDKPLPVLCNSINSVSKLVEVNKVAEELMKKHWPGPLTLVLKIKNRSLPKLLTNNSKFLGVRIPNNKCTIDFIEKCNGSIVGTSANISGREASHSIDGLEKELSSCDAIINGGDTSLKLESTVVKINGTEIENIREGFIKFNDLLT